MTDPAPSAAPLPRTWPLIWTVARREIVVKLQDKAFRISTAFLLLMMAASVAIPQLLEEDRPEYTVAVVGPSASSMVTDAATLASGAKDTSGVPEALITLVSMDDLSQAEEEVRTHQVDAAVTGDPEKGFTIIGAKEIPSELSQLFAQSSYSQRLSDGLTRAGVDADAVRKVLQQAATPPAEQLEYPDAEDESVAMYLSFAFAVVFLMTNMIFGVSIAQSVVEEKQSRVVEILVAAVPVHVLLAGKVIGNTVMVMAQLLLLLAMGIGVSTAMGESVIIELLAQNSGWFVLFFLLGFVMLACLWAVAGSLSSRLEDLNATTVPMQMLLFIPFFVALYLPETGRAMTGLSFVPLFSPMMMPRRLLVGNAAWWEGIVACGIIVVVGALLVGVAARLYQGSLLHTGSRTTLRAAWSSHAQERGTLAD
jgi:ABC-2 type transport system permease protein